MLEGLKKYIEQEVKQPIYSEVYWSSSAGGILTETFDLGEKVKFIVTNSIIITTPGAADFTDNYNRKLFSIGAIGNVFLAFAFWYVLPGNEIKITTANPGCLFSVSYQLITEHKLNR